MRFALVVMAATLAHASATMAQQCVSLPHSDGLPGPALVTETGVALLEPAFEDYAFMLFDICDVWAFETSDECGIYTLMGDIGWNAIATTCDGNRVIAYDRRLSALVGGDGAQAVIAHELGHHICGHLEDSNKISSHEAELQADRFAGASMRKLGYTIDAALSFAPILSGAPSDSHPAADLRVQAIIQGWSDPDAALHCGVAN